MFKLVAGVTLALASLVVLSSAHGHEYHVLDACVKAALPELQSVPVSQLVKDAAVRMHNEEQVLAGMSPEQVAELKRDSEAYLAAVHPILVRHQCLNQIPDHRLYVQRHYPQIYEILDYAQVTYFATI